MSLTPNDLLKYAYYTCIPEIYREEDAELDYPLYRYLSSIILGGYSLQITDIENLIALVDPEKCPSKFFPLLYESFGFEYYPDVDIKYHRRFLLNFGELRKRRGTYSSIRFLVRVLTSMDVEQSYLRGEYEGEQGRHLILDLQAKSISDIINLDVNKAIIEQFLGLFVPYYITTHITGSIANQIVQNNRYTGQALVYKARYNVYPYGPIIKAPYIKIHRASAVSSAVRYSVGKKE